MRRIALLFTGIFLLSISANHAQAPATASAFTVTVTNDQKELMEGAVIEITHPETKKLVKSALTNKNGVSVFYMTLSEGYLISAAFTGYATPKDCCY